LGIEVMALGLRNSPFVMLAYGAFLPFVVLS
jgi:hypothetical protein